MSQNLAIRNVIEENLNTCRGTMFRIFAEHFKMNLEEKSEFLIFMATVVMSKLVGDSLELATEYEQAMKREVDSWLYKGTYSRVRESLMLFISHGVALDTQGREALRNDDLVLATTCAFGAVHFSGAAMAVAFGINKKAQDGLKGATSRNATLKAREAQSLEIYRSLGLEKLSAINAAERARRQGAPLSIDTLSRVIAAERKRGMPTKTSAMDSSPRAQGSISSSED